MCSCCRSHSPVESASFKKDLVLKPFERPSANMSLLSIHMKQHALVCARRRVLLRRRRKETTRVSTQMYVEGRSICCWVSDFCCYVTKEQFHTSVWRGRSPLAQPRVNSSSLLQRLSEKRVRSQVRSVSQPRSAIQSVLSSLLW